MKNSYPWLKTNVFPVTKKLFLGFLYGFCFFGSVIVQETFPVLCGLKKQQISSENFGLLCDLGIKAALMGANGQCARACHHCAVCGGTLV